MAHNIFREQFYGLRQPAWHGLGTVGQRDESVLDVAARMTIPSIALRPLEVPLRGRPLPLDGYKAILGCYPDSQGTYSNGDTTYSLVPYGVVTNQYHLLPHNGGNGFVQLWAECIPAPCETLGLLGQGETLFVTAQLPSFDVGGDEVQTYLAGFNTCDGKTAVRCCLTPVRVVCQNTMTLGLAAATQTLAVTHLSDPRQAVRDWLREVWYQRVESLHVLQEALSALASKPLNDREAVQIYNEIYTTTPQPETDDLDLLAAWQARNRRNREHQEACLTLFQDSPTITSATRGTLWGAYNAVVEYEDFGKKRLQATSAFVGEGAKRKQKAFDTCLALV